MSPCETGCGGVASAGHVLCPACARDWADSTERAKAVEVSHGTGEWSWETAALEYLRDFVARRRAELRNGAGVGQ